ncbi:VWA domain-containing protein (plasmid) [Embleya sp. NBC_00888]|uniref:vWA domain-containing protein n=1 Tax=Embleya sp. NBC_00888 TaxID=2975960 RepID=UPI002F908675|nr:VWA domain-containing protein [Embleya sp. NBC_00888]
MAGRGPLDAATVRAAVAAPTRRDGVETLVAFARTVRAAGVPADPGRVQAFLTAAAELGADARPATYWAGRLTLCSAPEELARYDAAFTAYFDCEQPPPGRRRPDVDVERAVGLPGPDEVPPRREESDDEPRIAAADRTEILRRRDIAALDPAARAELRRLLALLRPAAPTRRTRRRRPARHGRIDRTRTVRAALRTGEFDRLRYTDRVVRPRRLVLLLDVSGSMAPYADALLRFGHAAVRRRRGAEVFTIGTRLTRISRELAHTDPNRALAAASAAVPDFSGGTRLGDQLHAFLEGWGRRGVARGAVLVIASDGWERGDPDRLAVGMARLHRLAHRVIWVNPHRAREGYQPLAAGMAAALPYVDDFVAGHSLAALEELCALLVDERGTG